jgi:hypothetical protein
MTSPKSGTHQPKQPLPPVNPDPKAHPMHPKVPVQPIPQGTDPKAPVKTGE